MGWKQKAIIDYVDGANYFLIRIAGFPQIPVAFFEKTG